jgi:hypothetical protein
LLRRRPDFTASSNPSEIASITGRYVNYRLAPQL